MTEANYGDYWWPDLIDTCRSNLLGLRDPQVLEVAERERSLSAASDLIADPSLAPATFDLAHLQAIHRHLFRDVYAWAGQLRVCELVRPDEDPNQPGHQFIPPERIPEMADLIVRQIGHPGEWPPETGEVVTRLAALYSSVNVLHPFFEGNGRTNRLFCGQAAEAAGHRIDWRPLAHSQNALMAAAFTVGHEPVRQALRGCVEPLSRRPRPGRPSSAARRFRPGPELG